MKDVWDINYVGQKQPVLSAIANDKKIPKLVRSEILQFLKSVNTSHNGLIIKASGDVNIKHLHFEAVNLTLEII